MTNLRTRMRADVFTPTPNPLDSAIPAEVARRGAGDEDIMDAYKHNPHEALFQDTFGDPERAASHLREVLPAALSSRVDWSRLRHAPTEYKSLAHPERRNDLFFEVALQDGERSRPLLLWLLFEHQRSDDRWMVVRILMYLALAWDRWRKRHESSREPLPLILPIVLYHGESKWRSATAFHDLFDLSDDLRAAVAPYLPSFEFVLQDVPRMQPEQLRGNAIVRIYLEILQYRDGGRAIAHLAAAVNRLPAEEWTKEESRFAVGSMTVYLRFLFDVQEQEIRAAFAHAPKEVQEVVMNTAERLMKQGEERGKHSERVQLVARALERGMPESEIADFFGISIEDVGQLAEEAKQQASAD